MKVLLKLLLITILLVSQTYQRCGFDHEKQKNMKIEKVDLFGDQGRFLQTTSWTPIRIYLDYTTLEGQKGTLTDAMIANIKTLMGKVATAFQGLINVKASTSKLKIGSCDPQIKIASAVSTAGVDADIVIFPFVDTTYGETTEAAASFCAQDGTTNRPVAGYVAFNKFMDFNKTNAMYYYALLVFHELNHVLSFNASLFDQFIDSAGKPIEKSKVVTTKTINGVARQLISTPKVVAAARKHFGCNTADGIELENQGGLGTAGSHWEMRTMAGDFMIGESYAENVISDMSLALMEDSGWYTVNYYTGGLFRFGKNKGCEFLTTKCVTSGTTKFPAEYSTTMGANTCFTGRTSKGVSSLQKGISIDSNYQYFSDTTMGGQKNADYCPVATDYSDNNAFFAYSCWNGKSGFPASMGEKIGDNSNCFISSLTPQNDSTASAYKGVDSAICYDVTCSPSDKTYTVNVGKTSVKCSSAGGQVNVSGFDGVLNCADYNLVCTRSVACGDTLDCITKKTTGLTADYTNYGTPSTASGSTTTATTGTTTTATTGTTTTGTTGSTTGTTTTGTTGTTGTTTTGTTGSTTGTTTTGTTTTPTTGTTTTPTTPTASNSQPSGSANFITFGYAVFAILAALI